MMKAFSPLKPMNREFDFFFGANFFHWPEKSLELKTGRICRFRQDLSGYHFSFQIPGIHLPEVTIDVAGNTLIVRCKRHDQENIETYLEKFLLVPEDADIENIEANLLDSNLTLKIPKVYDSRWRDIEAKAPVIGN